ncbi:MAG TPA: trehalase family glycosidase [Candidatus Saccharimonadales bacterium]|nr:trehalase family glycosidase [Candidatus Saccharimonadales bacterium]
MDKHSDLINAAREVLDINDLGSYTVPSRELYPHQWLWDSCFIAIGLANYDTDRAKTEILSLINGQWSNGMLPNVIFAKSSDHSKDADIWKSWLSPFSPDHLSTSGITQPPMLAEAIVRIGQKLSIAERRSWYRTVFKPLLAYHSWLYNERDPHQEGLVLLVHPWECGLDNTPPWMSELHSHLMPWWIRLIEKLRLDWVINLLRRDTRHVSVEQRPSAIEALTLFSVQKRLMRKAYNVDKILTHSLFAIEDLTFNSILIRANEHLLDIAKTIKEEVPKELIQQMEKTESALEQLWDPYTNQYYSRNFVTHDLIKEPSIAAMMPLYAGVISKDKADKITQMLENKRLFGPAYPVPSAPINSPWFRATGYWQGPTWMNTNWLIIDGLHRMGYTSHADALSEVSVELVNRSGFYEYYDPTTGDPAGIDNFSWTAAVTVDLLSKK